MGNYPKGRICRMCNLPLEEHDFGPGKSLVIGAEERRRFAAILESLNDPEKAGPPDLSRIVKEPFEKSDFSETCAKCGDILRGVVNIYEKVSA